MRTPISGRLPRRLLLTLAAVAATAGELGAQRSSAERWRLTPILSSETEFDDNVFLVEPSRRDNLADPSAEALASGRYADMRQASDLVSTVRAELEIEGRGLFGRDLAVTPGVRYELYAQNTERSNATLDLTVDQQLSGGRRLRLRARATPSYFTRNYLEDAVDADGSGSIAPGERRYAPGRYRDTEVALAYRVRLAKSTKQSPFGASVQFEVGHYARSFEAPFAVRDMAGPTGGAELSLALTRRVSASIGYGVEALGATPAPAVLLLDEADFGRDLNGNGSATDTDIRAIGEMDVSRLEQQLELRIGHERLLGMEAELGVSRRWRRFGSEEPYDVANNGRSDGRTELSLEASRRLTSELRLVGGVRLARQSIARANDADATGDDVDYERRRVRLGLSYRF